MYDYTDIILHYLERQFIKIFRRLKSILKIDEINVMQATAEVYADAEQLIRKMFLQLAVHAYKDTAEKSSQYPDFYWMEYLLTDYDPVAKYVFTNELERKRAKLAEAMLSSKDVSKEVDAGMRALAFQVREFAVRITDEAVMKAFEDDGVKYAMWVTEHDGRVCDICMARDGKVYPLAKFPDKPHYGCRCTRERVLKSEK